MPFRKVGESTGQNAMLKNTAQCRLYMIDIKCIPVLLLKIVTHISMCKDFTVHYLDFSFKNNFRQTVFQFK